MMIVGCGAAIITITVGPRPARRRGPLSAVHMGHCSQGAGAKRNAHGGQRVVGAREWEAYRHGNGGVHTAARALRSTTVRPAGHP